MRPQCVSQMPSSTMLRQSSPGGLPYDLPVPAGGPPGLPASTSLQTALADLLDSQHRLVLASQSASASPMQGSDTDAAATVAAASITQAAIQVGPSGFLGMAVSLHGSPAAMLYAEIWGAAMQMVPGLPPSGPASSTVAWKLPC